MQPIRTLIPAAAVVATFAACAASTDRAPITTFSSSGASTAPAARIADDRDHALVRFVHAIPTGATVDLYADDDKTFAGVGYRTVTAYAELDDEHYTLRLRPAGVKNGKALASRDEDLHDGEYYTVIALPGDDAEPRLRVIHDEFSRPPSGKARVRVVHAARGLDEVDVVAAAAKDDDTIVNDVKFDEVTDYRNVDAWDGDLIVRLDDERVPVTAVNDVRVAAGGVYTVVVVGRPGSRRGIDALIIEDRIGPETR